MKIKKIRNFKSLYVVNNPKNTSDKELEKFLFCGDLNWDYYFSDKVKNSEKLKSLKLIEFYNKIDLEKYLSEIKRSKLMDYFLDKKYFAVLELK